MLSNSRLNLLLLAALVMNGCAGFSSLPLRSQRGRPSDRIQGRVVSLVDGPERPIPGAHIKLSIPGEPDSYAFNITNAAGFFMITELRGSDPFHYLPLRRATEYEIEVLVPGYRIANTKQRFMYERGLEEWALILDPKPVSLTDEVPQVDPLHLPRRTPAEP